MPNATKAEALRQLEICHSCRYCEGYCSTFGALARLPLLTEGDVPYLASVCHDCRACFQACMYVPPHEFALNLPLALSAARTELYEEHAFGSARTRCLQTGTRGLLLLLGVFVLLTTIAASAFAGFPALGAVHRGAGAFYVLIPSRVMFITGLVLGVGGSFLVVTAQIRYWTDCLRPVSLRGLPQAILRAASDAALLSSMRGGGQGCFYPRADFASSNRRRLHGAMAFGFVLTFLATCAAAIYQHVLGRIPPYGVDTAPVVLGLVGGLLLLTGTAGLLVLKWRSDDSLQDRRGRKVDVALLTLLLLLSLTGLLLLAARSTALMPTLLDVHLAVVGAFFVLLPYTKLVHAAFRLSALIRSRLDEPGTALR